MISPRIRELADSIQPLFNDQAAQALNDFWASIPTLPGGFGRLEDFAKHVAMVRNETLPACSRLGLYLICAEHAVAAAPVGAEGPAGTRRDLANFLRGASPASILARQFGIDRLVVDCGLTGEAEQGTHVYRVCDGALDFTIGAALTEDQLNTALDLGASLADDAARRFDCVAIAQLGSGSSVAASAVLGALTGRPAIETTYLDDILDPDSIAPRRNAVSQGAIRHQLDAISPLAAVRCFGGLDLAVMAGFLLAAANARLPVFADGFCGAVAALVSRSVAPDSLDAVLFPGCSNDPAWLIALETLAVTPLLQFEASEGAGFHAVLALHLVSSILNTARLLAPAPVDADAGAAAPSPASS
ncbi:MAG: nicotinate-nucleotide--dimethylbenzimidazole phosphoribosyltransferase [Bryobacteraceae bacterium]